MTRHEDVPCPHCGRPPVQDGEASPFCPKCRFPIRPIAGKYRLIKQLARGGGGIIYLAHHLRLTREPARVIKIIHPECLEVKSLYIRFQREVEITAMLSQRNQHIVRIYDDFGEEPWIGAYYVMEYLEGTTLMDLIYQKGTLPFILVKKIFGQLCRAIAAAHQEGIIHRDLKPPNIFLIQHEEEPYFVKIIDFGIAKSLEAQTQHDLTHGSMGTPTYMSPEQCMNEDIDGRADIYSMGCILYEMLTGTPPFTIGTNVPKPPPWAIMQRHISEAPESLLERRPEFKFSQELNDVVMRALEKKPTMRYPNVMAFWEAFDLALPETQVLETAALGQKEADAVLKSVHRGPVGAERVAKRLYFEAPQVEVTNVKPTPTLAAFAPSLVSLAPSDAFAQEHNADTERLVSLPAHAEHTAITPMPGIPLQQAGDIGDQEAALKEDPDADLRVVPGELIDPVAVILGLEIADSTEATSVYRPNQRAEGKPTRNDNHYALSQPTTRQPGRMQIVALLGLLLVLGLVVWWFSGQAPPGKVDAGPSQNAGPSHAAHQDARQPGTPKSRGTSKGK